MELHKEFRFEASHILPKHQGKCRNLHGHSWVLTVFVGGRVDPETGMVLDYYKIKDTVQPLIDSLDHKHLGGWVVPLMCTPEVKDRFGVMWLPWDEFWMATSENLLIAIAKQLPKEFPWTRLALNETCTTSACLDRREFDGIQR